MMADSRLKHRHRVQFCHEDESYKSHLSLGFRTRPCPTASRSGAIVSSTCPTHAQIRHHGGSLSFRKLTNLMAALLPNHDEATFSHVELPAEEEAGWDTSSCDYGDTRAVSL